MKIIPLDEEEKAASQGFFTISAPPPLTIETEFVEAAVQKTAYQANLTAIGGLPPHVWSLLNGEAGQLSGTPEECGEFDFTVRLTDSAATPHTASKSFRLNVICCNDYTLQGTIPDGTGATVVLSGNTTGNTTVDGIGNFIFEHLTNETYTLTPELAHFTFSPACKEVTVNNRDATGIDFTLTADDTDSDGMPDYWKVAYGLNHRVDDAPSDLDKDRMTNLEEFLAGSDPADRNDPEPMAMPWLPLLLE